MHMQNGLAAAAADWSRGTERGQGEDAQRAGLEALLDRVNETLPAHVLHALGPLTATGAPDGNHAPVPQIRSRPIGSSGCEFRYPGEAPEPRNLDLATAQIVATAVRTLYAAPRMGEWLSHVRSMVARELKPGAPGTALMALDAMGLTPFLDGDDFETTIDLAMLGRDLRPTVERVSDADLFRLEEGLKGLVSSHLLRGEALARATAEGVRGWIDDAALAVLGSAGLDLAEVVSALETRDEVSAPHRGSGGEDRDAAVFWVDGTLRAYVEDCAPSAAFRLDGQELSIRTMLPATVVAALPGRRLREVVDLDLIPASALIVEATERSGWLVLGLRMDRSPVGRAAGG